MQSTMRHNIAPVVVTPISLSTYRLAVRVPPVERGDWVSLANLRANDPERVRVDT